MRGKFFCVFCLAILVALLSGCVQPEAENNGSETVVERVAAGDQIAVEYSGTLEDGTLFDSSEGRQPLEFEAGAGQMIAGFDSAVIGMALNEDKTVELQPSEAYGESDPYLVVEINKSQIEDADSLEVGAGVTNSDGVNGTVQEILEDSVIVDFNHPLAGKTLTFWIKVVSIN